MNVVGHDVTITAPARLVWRVFTDVEHRPDWTPSVVRAAIVDGAGTLAVGTAVRIKQPRMPELVWMVTAVDIGRSWTWVATSPVTVSTSAR